MVCDCEYLHIFFINIRRDTEAVIETENTSLPRPFGLNMKISSETVFFFFFRQSGCKYYIIKFTINLKRPIALGSIAYFKE